MAVNLLAALDDERFGAAELARAHQIAEAAGFTLHRTRGIDDDRLAAWIDYTFGASFWSSEVRAANVWVARRGEEIGGFAAFGPRGLPLPWLLRWRERADVAIFGPYGVAEAQRKTGLGGALLTAALASLRASGYAHALIPAVSGERLIAAYRERTGAEIVDEFRYDEGRRARAVILASGAGTNARNVLERARDGVVPLDVVALITNDAHAGAIGIARDHDVSTVPLVWERSEESRAQYDARVIEAIRRLQPDLVLLLGWMHLLPAEFLARFPHTLNVHPSFLPFDPTADEVVMPDGTVNPALRGAHALRDALRQGLRWSGATVHRVTALTDRGAVLVRTPMPTDGATTEPELRERVRPLEFAAVTQAIRRWAWER
ncbi:MAG TPA: GNAT family N-acetyltransferase [Candidatus Elarobacter sp.]|jgi:phosphoribosylglycinamide formyltransferase-1